MLQLLHFRLKIVTADGRVFVGQMLAFDRHMNLVLSECEEFRKISAKKGQTGKEREEKRVLGLIVLRGETIVSLSVEGPPTTGDKKMRVPAVQAMAGVGPGLGRPAGRGIPASAPGVAPVGAFMPQVQVLTRRRSRWPRAWCWTRYANATWYANAPRFGV
jgi:small nuclear ribonucleoprotein B and B'